VIVSGSPFKQLESGSSATLLCDGCLTAGGDPMKAYVVTTGAVFGLITVAHVLRVIAEGPHLVTDPWYVLLTVAAATLCLWAFRLVTPRSSGRRVTTRS
jgi:hypothetical protein